MKLLPSSVDPIDSSQASLVSTNLVSTSLVPLTQRAITTQSDQIGLVPSDAFAWSSSTSQGEANVIDGTPVEDPDSDETGALVAEYVSGWAGSNSVERTAIAHYLFYAAGLAGWSRWLINVYA